MQLCGRTAAAAAAAAGAAARGGLGSAASLSASGLASLQTRGFAAKGKASSEDKKSQKTNRRPRFDWSRSRLRNHQRRIEAVNRMPAPRNPEPRIERSPFGALNEPTIYEKYRESEGLPRPESLPPVSTKNPKRMTDEERLRHLTNFAEMEDVQDAMYTAEQLQTAEEHVLKDVNWDRYQKALDIADANLLASDYNFEENTLPAADWENEQVEGVRAERLNRETELEQLKFLSRMRHFMIIDRRRHVTISPKGRIESYSAMMVAGNGRGVFAYAHCRGLTSDEAETKCLLNLHKNVIVVPLFENRTLYYNVYAKHRQTKIKMLSVRREHCYRACPMIYFMARCVGFKDLSTKVIGNRNKYQVVKAFIKSLLPHTSDREAAMHLGQNYYTMFDRSVYQPPRPNQADIDEQSSKIALQIRKAHEDWELKMHYREHAGLTGWSADMYLFRLPASEWLSMRPSDFILPKAPCYVPIPEQETQPRRNPHVLDNEQPMEFTPSRPSRRRAARA